MVLDELAKVSGYSVPQFSRLFVKYTGISAMRYVNIVRIQNSIAKQIRVLPRSPLSAVLIV